jgi:hypothetical protein
MNSIWITESSSQSILNVIRDEGGVVEEGDTMCRHSRTSQSQTNPRYWSSLVRAKKNTNEKSNAFGKLAAACKALSLSYLDVGLVDEVEITGIPDESFRTAGRYDSSAATQQILLIFYSSMH